MLMIIITCSWLIMHYFCLHFVLDRADVCCRGRVGKREREETATLCSGKSEWGWFCVLRRGFEGTKKEAGRRRKTQRPQERSLHSSHRQYIEHDSVDCFCTMHSCCCHADQYQIVCVCVWGFGGRWACDHYLIYRQVKRRARLTVQWKCSIHIYSAITMLHDQWRYQHIDRSFCFLSD